MAAKSEHRNSPGLFGPAMRLILVPICGGHGHERNRRRPDSWTGGGRRRVTLDAFHARRGHARRLGQGVQLATAFG